MKKMIGMRLSLFAFILTLVTSTLTGQNEVEKMIARLPSVQNDLERVILLNEIAYQLRKETDDPRGLQYAREAYELAKKNGFEKDLGDSYVRLGLLHHYRGNYAEAIDHFEKAAVVRLGLEDYSGASGVYLNLGNSHFENFDPDSAISAYRKGINILDEHGDKPSSRAKLYNAIAIAFTRLGAMDSASTYINQGLEIRKKNADLNSEAANSLLELGNIYRRQGLYENALEAYREALWYSMKFLDSTNLAQTNTGIGNVFLDTEQYDSSLAYYEKAREINESKGRMSGLGVVYNNMGKAFLHTERYFDAEKALNRSLEIKRSLSDTMGMAITENLLGELALITGKTEGALLHFDNALKYTDESKNPVDAITLYENISKAFKSKGRYQEALDFHTKSSDLKAEIENKYLIAQDLQLSLEKEKADKANLKRKTTFNQAVAIITVLVSVGVLLLLYNSARNRRNRQRVAQKVNSLLMEIEHRSSDALRLGEAKERRRIADELHDSVGSMLSTVKFLLAAFKTDLPELPEKKLGQFKEANEVLIEASEEVREISHNLRKGWNKETRLVEQIREMAEKIKKTEMLEVHVNTHNMTANMSPEKEIILYRIIQELVSNALKHAKAGNLTIQLNQLPGIVNIIIEDDGRGFNRRKLEENKSGIGLKSVMSRVQSLEGKMKLDSGKGAGTSVTIDIPLAVVLDKQGDETQLNFTPHDTDYYRG